MFGLLGIVWVIRQRLQNKPVSPTLIASIFLALPYAHYAYSRADLAHLAPGIPPFLIGIFALLASQPAKIKWPFAALLCGASLLVMLPTHPWWYCYSTQQCVDIKVAGDKLKVDRETAGNLAALNKLAEQFAPGNRTFIAAPFWPGAYAALGRKSPMWEIYVLFPRSVAFQQAEIERIKAANPGFVVIDDFPLDGREDMRFRNMNPGKHDPKRQTQPPPADVDALIALYNARRYAEAESRTRALLGQYPDFGFGWQLLGGTLQMQGKDALSAFQKVTELLPDDAEAHYNLGVVLKSAGRLDEALASYRRAVALKPDYAEAHSNLGNTLKDLGRLDDAVASYRRALKIKPDSADAHNNLGTALKDLGPTQ